ncbi:MULTISPECIES: hypothetical protein [Pseudomonas]|uniref:Phage protein n=1 Tax=Pseudomonas putida NBRC 14164 TaxID=1211579 RepID=A0ABN5UKU5_PSEPU|nr:MULTISPECIES: hypothetical protein [Pseudomonas]MCX9135596.1 hypothetical protein [Pseudomonas sp. DCB_PUT]MDD1969589.1 hypothetical protein [Pseudomonas putida]MDO1464819.1 hypothetical protein [Pseudomonas putida]MDO1470189.1 hypothetical protein [Pseudomonas putida]MDZ7325901.1 hypothetical protein [Pseudomonas sp. SDS3-8]
MSDSIQVEPIDGPDEDVPVDGIAAVLTDSVGIPNDAGPDTPVPEADATAVEEYDAHAQQRDEHLSDDGQEDEQGPQGKQQQRVPLGALQEERRARQAAQEQARQLQAQLAQLQAQQDQFRAMQQQLAAQQQAQQIPAFEDDPEGHVAAKFQQIEQHIVGQQQAAVQRAQFEQAAAQVGQELQEMAPQVVAIEQEFAATHSDYHDAYAHLNAEVDRRIAQQHPHASPAEHAFAKQIALLAFVKDSQAKGLNPAQLIYGKAQELGYQAQHRAPAPARRQAPTSLSTLAADGKAPDQRGHLSASQVSNMSNEDFDALWSQMAADARTPGFGL